MGSETFKATLKIVGPIKRSTFGAEAPDRVSQALNDILHWSWATRLQIQRLARSLRTEFRALSTESRLKARRCFSTTTYDEHLVFVAATNLQRAIDRAPRELRSDVRQARLPSRELRLLRNVYEHWDELRQQLRAGATQRTGSAEKLLDEFPDADPWSFTFDPQTGEIVLAGVVQLRPLAKELRRLEARLLRRERARARASNTDDQSEDDESSRVTG